MQTRAGRRAIFNRFWQLNDVAGELGMNDTAIMRRMQTTSILWLGTLRSSKQGSPANVTCTAVPGTSERGLGMHGAMAAEHMRQCLLMWTMTSRTDLLMDLSA